MSELLLHPIVLKRQEYLVVLLTKCGRGFHINLLLGKVQGSTLLPLELISNVCFPPPEFLQ